MKMKECLECAAVFLQLQEAARALKEDDAAAAQDTVNELLECGNFVLGEIACDYLPIQKNVPVFAENGRVNLSAINEKIIAVRRVLCKGKSVPFTAEFDAVLTRENGELVLQCHVEPPLYAISDEIVYKSGITARVIGYGIACEYCLINGMSDEAVLWDKRYKDGLESAALPKNERRVRARSWL